MEMGTVETIFTYASFALLALCGLALVRVIKGPTAPDRVIGVDAINTFVICMMVLFGAAYHEPIYIDIAIIYALLSYISTLFVAKYLERGKF